MDPFQGKLNEPISRHRYQYGNNDPVNNTDPSGLLTLSEVATTAAIVSTLSFGVQAGYLISRGQADEARIGQALLNSIALGVSIATAPVLLPILIPGLTSEAVVFGLSVVSVATSGLSFLDGLYQVLVGIVDIPSDISRDGAVRLKTLDRIVGGTTEAFFSVLSIGAGFVLVRGDGDIVSIAPSENLNSPSTPKIFEYGDVPIDSSRPDIRSYLRVVKKTWSRG
jgi:hypothetical protein